MKIDLDLNLLLVFAALMKERNVTKAAARVGLTQSAASSALGRLRAQLEDPLFVRTQQGMTPTARAKVLDQPIRQALDQIQFALKTGRSFIPSISDRAFRIMVTDHALIKIAPLMAGLLAKDAPSIRLDISSVAPESDFERIRDGEADLMISFLVLQPPPSFKSMKLFSDRLVVLARRGRFNDRAKLTLREYVSADHALVAPRGGWVPGPTDQLLAEKGMKRNVRMAIPHYLAAPYCVAFSDLLVTVPESVADECIKILPLVKFELPLETRPFIVSMVWHDRNHDDPAHCWLRRQIKAGCRTLR